MNTVIAVFANGGTMTTTQTALWQYDYGQVLIVQGIQLPTSYEVQFCNAGDSTTITSLGDSDGVVIPDQFLQNGETIYAYIYLHTGPDDGETEYKITIPVMDRAEPTDIQPTPQQESTIGQLVSALNDAVSHVDDVADGIPTAIDTALAEAKASGEFDGPAGADGADGSGIWYTTARVSPGSGTPFVRRRYLIGREGAEVQVHDLLIAPAPGEEGEPTTLYEITRVSLACDLSLLCKLKGEDGYSPAVTITEITGGHRITITDEAHPQGQSFDVMDGSGGGGGTSDYNDLSNKPQIGGVTLSGNKSLADLGAAPAGAYVKPSGGIPKTDLAAAVQTSLGKADTALQLGDVAEPFFVTYSTSDMSTWTCDKAFAQIVSAMAAGKQVVMIGSVGGTPIAQGCDILLANDGDTYLISFWIRYARNGWYHIIHHADDSIEFYDSYIDSADLGAVASDQGVSHAGEFLVVGSDGNVTTMTLATWQGGSY